jgi:hypothetical protein
LGSADATERIRVARTYQQNTIVWLGPAQKPLLNLKSDLRFLVGLHLIVRIASSCTPADPMSRGSLRPPIPDVAQLVSPDSDFAPLRRGLGYRLGPACTGTGASTIPRLRT